MRKNVIIKLGALGDSYMTYCMLLNNIQENEKIIYLTNNALGKFLFRLKNINYVKIKFRAAKCNLFEFIGDLLKILFICLLNKKIFILHPLPSNISNFICLINKFTFYKIYNLTRGKPKSNEYLLSDENHRLLSEINLLSIGKVFFSNTKLNYKLVHYKEINNLISQIKLKKNNQKKVITIFPSTGNFIQPFSNRDIPPEYLVFLINELIANKPNITIEVIGKSDKYNNLFRKYFLKCDIKSKVINNLCGLKSESLIESIINSDLVICVDSFPMYLAISFNINTYLIAGPTNPKQYIDDFQNESLQIYNPNIETCRYCYKASEKGESRMYTCREPLCMKTIDYKKIINDINLFLIK